MTTTLTAVFDGKVLRPEGNVELELNRRYRITVEVDTPPQTPANAWDVLESAAGSIEAPPDWSAEHDHYLYGTPKRDNQAGK